MFLFRSRGESLYGMTSAKFTSTRRLLMEIAQLIVIATIATVVALIAGLFIGRSRTRRAVEEERAFLSSTFQGVASEVLRRSNQDFLTLAEERLKRQEGGADAELQKRE